MIKRITNPEEAKVLSKDIRDIFTSEDENDMGHYFLDHDVDSILGVLNNKQSLFWNCFVWANEEDSKFDSIIIFLRDNSPKFGVEIFTEYLWLSKNPKVGFKLLKTATEFARNNGFNYISMSHTEKNPQKEKLSRLYNKLGFKKDCVSYIAKL
jgi:hypothetical protein